MKWVLTPVAAAALVLPILPTYAAGPYDGTWVIVAPGVQGGGADYDLEACNPVQLEFQIKDNQLVGDLRLVQYPQSGVNVESSPGSGSTPIQGSVAPDGKVTASWQRYRATGQLSGDKGEVRWTGHCGPRVAMATRIAQPAAAGTTEPPTKK